MALQIGSTDLRKEIVSGVIKGRADASYKFKQAVSITPTSAWDNSYYRENSAALTSQTGYPSKIPRGGNFPQASVEWTKHIKTIEKFGREENIIWEDILTDNINVQARTLFKIADSVAKDVDDQMWSDLTENQSPSEIQTFSVFSTDSNISGRTWDIASAAIIDDLMRAKQLIGQFNYPTNNLMCFISEKDHRSIIKYLTDSGAQYPSIGEATATNGKVGKLVGIQFVVSNSVTASFALVVVPKVCATWQTAVPLSTDVETDAFKSVRVRAVEEGVLQLTDPSACVLIEGTQSAA